MKTVFKPVLVFVSVLLAVFNIYKSINLYKSYDYPYDARNIYIAGKLWLKNQNPYNDSLLKKEWKTISEKSSFVSTKKPGFEQCGMIYPFWSIPMLSLYFSGNWLTSRIIIWILSAIFISIIVFFASYIFGKYGFKWWQILLLILCFKSTSTAILLGQPMLLSMAAITAMWYFYMSGKKTLSGFLLGIAYLKISLCLPFVVFFAANRNFKLLWVSSIIPIVSSLVFYLISGNFYLTEMLQNISKQMQINYAGNVVSSINTNLTEIGILFNYFGGISFETFNKLNLFMLAVSFAILTFLYKKQIIDLPKFIALIVLCNFMYSYHLVYDCLLLLFIIPSIKYCKTALLIALPLFLPINGIFKNVDFLHFHLPVVLAILFLYIIFENYFFSKLRNK